jgi:hypothetical protein
LFRPEPCLERAEGTSVHRAIARDTTRGRYDELPRILPAGQPGVEITPVHPLRHVAAKRACVRPSA